MALSSHAPKNEGAHIIASPDKNNCAFHSFAIWLTQPEILDAIEKDHKADVDFNEFIKLAATALKTTPNWKAVKEAILKLRKDDPSLLTLQTTLGQPLRQLSILLIRKKDPNKPRTLHHLDATIATLSPEFKEYLEGSAKLNIPTDEKYRGDIYNRHSFITTKFEELYQAFETELKKSAGFNLERYRTLKGKAFATLTTGDQLDLQLLDRIYIPLFDKYQNNLTQWWKTTGYKQFLTAMETAGAYAGDPELATLAEYFGVDLQIKTRGVWHEPLGIGQGNFPAGAILRNNIKGWDLLTQLRTRGIIIGGDIYSNLIAHNGDIPLTRIDEATARQKLEAIPSYDLVIKELNAIQATPSKVYNAKKFSPEITSILLDRNVITRAPNGTDYKLSNLTPEELEIRLKKIDNFDEIFAMWKRAHITRPLFLLVNENASHWDAVLTAPAPSPTLSATTATPSTTTKPPVAPTTLSTISSSPPAAPPLPKQPRPTVATPAAAPAKASTAPTTPPAPKAAAPTTPPVAKQPAAATSSSSATQAAPPPKTTAAAPGKPPQPTSSRPTPTQQQPIPVITRTQAQNETKKEIAQTTVDIFSRLVTNKAIKPADMKDVKTVIERNFNNNNDVKTEGFVNQVNGFRLPPSVTVQEDPSSKIATLPKDYCPNLNEGDSKKLAITQGEAKGISLTAECKGSALSVSVSEIPKDLEDKLKATQASPDGNGRTIPSIESLSSADSLLQTVLAGNPEENSDKNKIKICTQPTNDIQKERIRALILLCEANDLKYENLSGFSYQPSPTEIAFVKNEIINKNKLTDIAAKQKEEKANLKQDIQKLKQLEKAANPEDQKTIKKVLEFVDQAEQKKELDSKEVSNAFLRLR